MTRVSDFPIASMFLERWSPRAFDGSVISHTDLMTIIEAGRWAPSCYNYQPWRFIYIHREAEDWDQHIDRLDPLNQDWAAHASALVYLVTDTLMGPSEEALAPSHFHGFDGGAASAHMNLQANALGYHIRAMAGIDRARSRVALSIPDRYTLQVAMAIGRKTSPDHLSETYRAQEVLTARKPLETLVAQGKFSSALEA